MENIIIEVKNLCKSYDKKQVVTNFNMNVEKGHIYGIIGPNGAGKTTFFRMLAGLLNPDSGEISFWGEKKDLDSQRRRISFMIEAPYIDLSLSARDNLMAIRYLKGVADENKIDEVLELVNLSNTNNKTAGKFSLGMKQRLGIAIALLSSPEVMVLDEPVNGLDPQGMVEIRTLLKKLCEEKGVTILISSHILTELYQLSTDYLLINKGNIIDNLNSEELDAKCRSFISIKTDNINATAAIIEDILGTKEYKVVYGEKIHLFDGLDDLAKVSRAITSAGQTILDFHVEGESLEEYYLEKVGDINE